MADPLPQCLQSRGGQALRVELGAVGGRLMALCIVGAVLLVMSVAFVAIPYQLGGHPGEVRLASAGTWHPT